MEEMITLNIVLIGEGVHFKFKVFTFLHDSFFIIVAKTSRELIIIHCWSILLNTPSPCDLKKLKLIVSEFLVNSHKQGWQEYRLLKLICTVSQRMKRKMGPEEKRKLNKPYLVGMRGKGWGGGGLGNG